MSRTPPRTLAAAAAALALLVPSYAAAPAGGATTAPVAAAASDSPRVAAPAGTKIRTMTYNIRFGERGLGRVAADIRRSRATVVTLNEVDDRRGPDGKGVFQARALARELGMNFRWDPNGKVRPGIRGNAILSSYPITSVRRWDLPNPAGTEQRGLMRARIQAGPVSLDVWTSHLTPGAGRLKQSQAIRRTIGKPVCATVLGGDMNFIPGSREHRVVTSNLTDLWTRVGKGRDGGTGAGGKRIDYLFFKKSSAVSGFVAAPGASDHRALVGTVKVSANQSC